MLQIKHRSSFGVHQILQFKPKSNSKIQTEAQTKGSEGNIDEEKSHRFHLHA